MNRMDCFSNESCDREWGVNCLFSYAGCSQFCILNTQHPTLKQSTILVLESLAELEEIELINSYECRIKGKALTTWKT